MSFAIVTDTSANLPTELLKANDVAVVPFSYYINDEEFSCLDTSAFDGTEYYNRIREGMSVTTSQVNPQKYIDCWTPFLEKGIDILFIGMSSGISGSFGCAEMAAAQLKEDYPDRTISLVDTLGASLGEGLVVLKGVECRDQGLSLSDTTKCLLEMRERMYQIFTVDDLMHLRKTGRITGAVAVVGTLLNIKPLLKGNEKGQIVNSGKVRGRKRAIEALAEKYASLVVDAKSQTVGIAHADCEEDALLLAGMIRRSNPPKDIITVCYEPVTGSHVGPGTLALFFESSFGVRSK